MANLPIFQCGDVFTGPVKTLVKESHAIFVTIPRNDPELNKRNVIDLSRKYRSIVRECIENLRRDFRFDHTKQIKTFKELEVIWNLCEILLLDVSQAGALIIHLKNWIKMHFEELNPEERDMLENEQYQHDEERDKGIYEELLVRLVLRGEVRKAIRLLSNHTRFHQNDQMQLVASMLESMPLSTQYIYHEFCNKWTNWSACCKSALVTGQFDSQPHLSTIVRMLSQDETVYAELAERCDTWYQLMVAYLLYSDPCIRETDLPSLCRQMIRTFKSNHREHMRLSHEPDSFDEILISAFEYDLISVIANSCAHLDDNWWFVTHFIDLLHCSNQLQIHEIAESDKLRETYLQDYAATLFDDDLLWPVGVSYLDSCPTSGLFVLENLLSRIHISIDDEMKAHKIIAIAKRRGLAGVAKSVCLLMTRGWLSKTPVLTNDSIRPDKHKRSSELKIPSAVNLSNAFYWAVKSGDTPMITYMSDQYLYYYVKTGTFPEKSIFKSLRRSTLYTERLAFLAKYSEFKQVLEDSVGDPYEAVSSFNTLIASKIYPKFFCQKLLDDVKNIFVLQPFLVFRPDEMEDLIRNVEDIKQHGTYEDDVELYGILVKNMARALMYPVGLEK